MAVNQSTRLVGYARVSTQDQETDLQLDALRAAGVTEIYEEKASGASLDKRHVLKRCLASMGKGDTLVVYKIDRIARSLSDLLRILEGLTAKGAAIKSLTEPLDTSSSMGMFVIQVLGAVAQLERSIIRERSIAGQVAARARGRLPGAPSTVSPEAIADILSSYDPGLVTMSDLAKKHGVSCSAVKRVLYKRRDSGS